MKEPPLIQNTLRAEGRHSCLPWIKACSNDTDRNVYAPFELIEFPIS